MFKSPKWEDWVGIGLGAWLIASPWILGFSHQAAPTVNALLIGTVLVVGELLDLVVQEKPHRHRVSPRCKTERKGQGDEPEPLFGLA